MWPIVRVQAPCFFTSEATTASTDCSARVNCAARAGGRRPAAAQERRLSIEAEVRGREPTRRLAGASVAGMAALGIDQGIEVLSLGLGDLPGREGLVHGRPDLWQLHPRRCHHGAPDLSRK